MTTIIRPESYMHEQLPIETVPYFHNSGEWKYWDRLDTSRVHEDSFTYISGALYINSRNTKLKLQLSIDETRKPMPHIAGIATFAGNNPMAAFRRQLRIVYGVGKLDRVPYYVYHKAFLDRIVAQQPDDVLIDFQHSIPVTSSNRGNPLTNTLLSQAMCSIIVSEGEHIGCAISIGMFQQAYEWKDRDMSLVGENKLKAGQNYPVKLFHDYRDDYEDDV